MTEIECIVYGRVQRVGYRDYVATAAATCGVNGWVKNENNGTVRVCAQGPPDAIKAFIEYLHEGSVSAVVERVVVDWQSATQSYDDFSICS